MTNLQDMFKEIEDNVQNRLEGLPIFDNYKDILKQIINIDEHVFEMLYDEDTENVDDYKLNDVDLTTVHERLAQFLN
ncbi:hypothetical protein PZN54_10980 [Staphylococcus capitis]|uniref:Uncharacterized protein n=1 Tax=Staphylococcus warneri TaxID=1292 RepID=A0A8B2ZGZ7_STAWA|nr:MULTISPECIES: hypothetical protein [Staphylococcus]MDH9600762.1 hypothetical protein [Staphylococcus capitis]MDH9624324.1 hypothetical protein [Staphylococcus capitis]RGM28298.1 hypothetical protein DXC19_11470 [Staphylococcus warneri]